MLKNETIDRDGIRPYFQQLAKERNDAIVELVGAEELSEIEESLYPRERKEARPTLTLSASVPALRNHNLWQLLSLEQGSLSMNQSKTIVL